MNRPLEFRAKPKGKNNFIISHTFKISPSKVELWDLLNWVDCDPETLGQFTGLTDSEGTKVFEGDIVIDNSGEIFTVIFHNGKFMAQDNYGDVESLANITILNSKVLGNIFDNPELIKQES